jgi:hypothetical protein
MNIFCIFLWIRTSYQVKCLPIVIWFDRDKVPWYGWTRSRDGGSDASGGGFF